MSTKKVKTQLPSVEYKDSTIYKMVLVLSGFRALYGASGHEFIQRLKKLKGMDWEYFNTESFKLMPWIDDGIVKLGRKGVKEYSDYICVIYGIRVRDREYFYNNLMDFAVNQMPASLKGVTPAKFAMLKSHGREYLKVLSDRGGPKND